MAPGGRDTITQTNQATRLKSIKQQGKQPALSISGRWLPNYEGHK